MKVLVVDDSNTIRRSAEIFLKQGGHEVLLAEDGFDALSKINDNLPDLVFCDILMPRLDGYQMTTFAYPFGDCALGAKPIIDGRFLCGRGVRDGVNRARADRNLLQAVGLESRRLPGYDLEALVEDTAASKGWLIAYGHDVSDAPTPYGCRPEDIDRLIRLAKAADLDIQPVAAAWRLATQ